MRHIYYFNIRSGRLYLDLEFNDKVAVISGGSIGIDLAIAENLAKKNAPSAVLLPRKNWPIFLFIYVRRERVTVLIRHIMLMAGG